MNENKPESEDFLLRACYWASCFHRFQKRKDGKTPYINHPVEVAWILSSEGRIQDREILAAALLHSSAKAGCWSVRSIQRKDRDNRSTRAMDVRQRL